MREHDYQRRFLIESCDVRGHVVRLNDTWLDAIARTDYPTPVRQLLGEAFVAAALMANTIKFAGKLTLQVRATGDVHLLVVQVTNERTMRGLARWSQTPPSTRLEDAFGNEGRMIITIEADAQAEPYQGIVPLEGNTLSEALQNYFHTSEQLPTRLYLGVQDATAAGILIQKLPVNELIQHDADGWDRATALCSTLTSDELCEVGSETLLNRLFAEETVRVFESQDLAFHCSCSRQRTDGMLQGIGQAEVDEILEEQGKVEIFCEFCDASYHYDQVDIAALFKGAVSAAGNEEKPTTPGDKKNTH